MNVDLNIDNYELDDILKLFKIRVDFDESDLKRAKQIVLKTHPDKSKLSPDYFLFYPLALVSETILVSGSLFSVTMTCYKNE